MTCSYCNLQHKFVFLLQEDVAGVGPQTKLGCFQCIQKIGEQLVREERQTLEKAFKDAPPDVTASLCPTCPGCGGTRAETCKDFPRHGHTWCDCQ